MKKDPQNSKLNERTGEQVIVSSPDSHTVKSEVFLEVKIAARLLLSLVAAVFGFRERQGSGTEDRKVRKEKRKENRERKT